MSSPSGCRRAAPPSARNRRRAGANFVTTLERNAHELTEQTRTLPPAPAALALRRPPRFRAAGAPRDLRPRRRRRRRGHPPREQDAEADRRPVRLPARALQRQLARDLLLPP